MIEDIFRGAQQPFELYAINNEEGLKKDVTGWSANEWIDAVVAHAQYGDENVKQHAASLISADREFEEKMGEWVGNMDLEGYYGGLEEEVASQVMAAIVDMGVSGERGNTLLHNAALNGHMDLTRALIDAGADVNKLDQDDKTPIFEAARYGQLDVVKLLIDAGADVNAIGPDGRTPLIVSSTHGHIEVIHVLMKNGADLNAVDYDGYTAYDVARNEETWEALQVKDSDTHSSSRRWN